MVVYRLLGIPIFSFSMVDDILDDGHSVGSRFKQSASSSSLCGRLVEYRSRQMKHWSSVINNTFGAIVRLYLSEASIIPVGRCSECISTEKPPKGSTESGFHRGFCHDGMCIDTRSATRRTG